MGIYILTTRGTETYSPTAINKPGKATVAAAAKPTAKQSQDNYDLVSNAVKGCATAMFLVLDRCLDEAMEILVKNFPTETARSIAAVGLSWLSKALLSGETLLR